MAKDTFSALAAQLGVKGTTRKKKPKGPHVTEVSVDLPLGDIWGESDLRGINVRASEDRYVAAVERAIRRAYPRATVRVNGQRRVSGGPPKVSVYTSDTEYPEADANTVDHVRDIIRETWEPFDWVVND